MKRETRLNLWFLIIFIALSLPGAVILFRKKLKPEARPIFMTDEVERRLPYMAPEPTPPGFTRVVPPRALAFVEDIARQQGGEVQLLWKTGPQGQRAPILSPDRQLQATALRRVGDTSLLDVVDWNASNSAGSIVHAELLLGQEKQVMAAQIQAAIQVPLPEPIFRELMNFGYIAPPKQIQWIELQIPAKVDAKQIRQINLDRKSATGTTRQTIVLPLR